MEGTGDLGVRLRAQVRDLGAHVVEVLRHFAGFVDGVEAVGGDLGAVGDVLDGGAEVGDRVAERIVVAERAEHRLHARSEEHTSELQSLMRISYAVFCLKKKKKHKNYKWKVR